MYIGLTTKEFKIGACEHVRDIIAAKKEMDVVNLKPVLRHFRQMYNSDPS